MGQSPIFENEKNLNIFWENSNEDYKLYYLLVENNQSSLNKQILQNYQRNENNKNNIRINISSLIQLFIYLNI